MTTTLTPQQRADMWQAAKVSGEDIVVPVEYVVPTIDVNKTPVGVHRTTEDERHLTVKDQLAEFRSRFPEDSPVHAAATRALEDRATPADVILMRKHLWLSDSPALQREHRSGKF